MGKGKRLKLGKTMFIIRSAFWLSLVIIFMPGVESEEQASRFDAQEAYKAAQSTYDDFSGFCDRNPAVCETGGQMLTAFGKKARDSAQYVYRYLDDKVGDDEKSSNDLAAIKSKPNV